MLCSFATFTEGERYNIRRRCGITGVGLWNVGFNKKAFALPLSFDYFEFSEAGFKLSNKLALRKMPE